MKTATIFTLTILFFLLTPSTLLAGDYWIRCSGSMNMLNMSDFNDGINQMNELVKESYGVDLLAADPTLSDAALADQVGSATNGLLLEELDNGLGFSIALARKMGSHLCAGLEYERMIATKDAIYNPTVAMNYSAPLAMTKFFVNTHVKEYKSMAMSLGGAIGFAKCSGSLQMPTINTRPAMKDAYLSGTGLVFEGHLLSHYKLEEGLSLYGTLGYRVAKLSESDQFWFGNATPPTEPGESELDDSIPLQLDFSGLFIKVGFQANLPW